MYAAFKIINSSLDIGMDFGKEYQMRKADDPRDITTLRQATQTGPGAPALAGDSTMSKFEKLVGHRRPAGPEKIRQPDPQVYRAAHTPDSIGDCP